MEQPMVKVTIPVPEDNIAGSATESVWAEPKGENTYAIKNIPFYAKGISYDDIVEAQPEDGLLLFKRVVQHSGHSTYRIYAYAGRSAPGVAALLEKLREMKCDIEIATDRLIGVDVLPEANIYDVYKVMDDAERADVIGFEEGHCAHQIQ